MLLVTFHGGSTGTNNIYGFSTSGSPTGMVPNGKPQTIAALSPSAGVTLDELRGMAVWGGNLYVVNGGKSASNVLVYKGPPAKGPLFTLLDTVIGSGAPIMHPFGIAFDASSLPCNGYVSNQDSNVIAVVGLTAGANGQVNGTLGSVSSYLSQTAYPSGSFVDGTFVASQYGPLAGMPPGTTSVSEKNGGLGVACTSGNGVCSSKNDKPANSVRDVAIANGILFVCDEVDNQINMYNLSGGAPLTPATAKGLKSPTHLAIYQDGLWVSAKSSLFWSALPASPTSASLSLQSIAVNVPTGNDVGGISFDDNGNVYVVFQDGKGTTGTGSIGKFAVTSGPPPTLASPGETFATLTNDTPEFCLWVSDSKWSS